MRFSANLTLLFTEVPFMERFERAAAAGFRAVEYMSPYEHDTAAIAAALREHRLEQVLFNFEFGNFAAGERGFASHVGSTRRWRDAVTRGIEIARALGCRRLNTLVGNLEDGVPAEEQRRVLVENLRHAADEAKPHGITVLVEALNAIESPRYLLTTSRDAFALLDEVARENVLFQYDVYHLQLMEGNLTRTITANLGRIGHIQIADPPRRHEPGTGEVNFRTLLRAIDEAGYEGYVGLEYRPSGRTEDSFGWMKEVAP